MILIGGHPGRPWAFNLNGHFGVKPAQIAAAGGEDSPLLNDVDVGDDDTEFSWILTTPLVDGGGTVVANDFGVFSFTGAADGSYTQGYRLRTVVGGTLTTHTPDGEIALLVGAAPALVLVDGKPVYKAAPGPTDMRLFLNNGARIAKTTAGTGDRLLTLGAGGAWQAGAAAP